MSRGKKRGKGRGLRTETPTPERKSHHQRFFQPITKTRHKTSCAVLRYRECDCRPP